MKSVATSALPQVPALFAPTKPATKRFIEFIDIEPVHVSAYVELLGKRVAKPSVKQSLAAIPMLFDWLVVGQVVATNPAAPVRGPKYTVRKGKTPVLAQEEARELLDKIDTSTMPCNHNLEAYLDAYINAAGVESDMNGYLFRRTRAKTRQLTAKLKEWRATRACQQMAAHESPRSPYPGSPAVSDRKRVSKLTHLITLLA